MRSEEIILGRFGERGLRKLDLDLDLGLDILGWFLDGRRAKVN